MSDSLISATVVDAKGRLLEASEKLNPDLLFALKGGGGGTYGIVVEATVRLLEIPVVTLARIKYANLEKAVQLFDRCAVGLAGGAGACIIRASQGMSQHRRACVRARCPPSAPLLGPHRPRAPELGRNARATATSTIPHILIAARRSPRNI